MQIIPVEQSENIYTVSRLASEVRFLLEDTFATIWVEGEISNFAAPNSGHWYFSLKDTSAQVRCAMFRASQRKLAFVPKDGMHVLLKARVSLYENRGEFQLIAEHLEERGEGKLRRAFELLKKKLEAAGLFDPAHKKIFPLYPKQIGIITSATGAAIRDILTVLKRRYTHAPIIIYPTLVQGEQAAAHIVKALQIANARNECDVLILARGGGSLEDLWPFNEETVAHAIFQSNLPVISGVGHEVDFTIADFVADKRAATPSAAAEIVTPDQSELLQLLLRQKQQAQRLTLRKLNDSKQIIIWMQKHLSQQHPKRRLNEKMQHLDVCELTLVQKQTRIITNLQNKLKNQAMTLHRLTPISQIHQLRNQLNLAQQKLHHSLTTSLKKQQNILANTAAKLNALSPLNTLKRGYAIVTGENEKVLYDADHVKIGEHIQVRLLEGSLGCRVEEIIKADKHKNH